MKKRNILGLFIILGCVLLAFAVSVTALSAEPTQEGQGNHGAVQQEDQYERVIKTYYLKYIDPDELINAGKVYILDATAHKNTISVAMYKKHVPDFEALLKKLDVEKKTVLFKVFTVIASKHELKEKEAIENKDLKNVLDELESLWKFKSYKVDGPSFLTVRDGSGYNFFKLVSTTYNFSMHIEHVNVKGEGQRGRIISVGQIQLRQIPDIHKDVVHTLISTEKVTLKEKGYLVAGISGIGTSGNALILVIGVEIK